jgi:hypothetical protein
MGCLISKEKENVEVVDIEENNKLMENLKFYHKQNKKQNKIIDFYDFHYNGKDIIL